MHIHTVLQQLGYTPQETKIYIASLQMGESTVSEIAQHVEIPRTTVTEIIAQMAKKGIMQTFAKRGHHVWMAMHPDKFMITLKEREAALQMVLPRLRGMMAENEKHKPTINVYKGLEQIRVLLNDIVASKHHLLVVISLDDATDILGKRLIEDIIEKQLAHFIKTRVITPRSPLSEALKKRDVQEMRTTRFLPSEIKLRRIANVIYGDNVAMISFNKKESTGIVVQDADVVHAMTIYFENLWDQSVV